MGIDCGPPPKPPKITKRVSGQDVEVPLDSVWSSICKVIKLSRILTSPMSTKEERETRIAFLMERLDDLEGMMFNERG